MQAIWYGDKRDLIKWSGLFHLAESTGCRSIVQIAFLREGEVAGLRISGQAPIPIHNVVRSDFRDLLSVTKMNASDISVHVFADVFVPQARTAYTHAAVEFTRTCESPKVILLDPDTGIAPTSGGDGKHVRLAEVAEFWEAARPGDWLAVYQHRPQRSSNEAWEQMKPELLARFAGRLSRIERQHYIDAPDIANDVVLIAAQRAR